MPRPLESLEEPAPLGGGEGWLGVGAAGCAGGAWLYGAGAALLEAGTGGGAYALGAALASDEGAAATETGAASAGTEGAAGAGAGTGASVDCELSMVDVV